MTDSEKAAFVLEMISNDNVSIPASLARKLAECQVWLETLTDPKRGLESVSKD